MSHHYARLGRLSRTFVRLLSRRRALLRLPLLPVLLSTATIGGQTVFHVDAPYVKVPVTVLDENGRGVIDLGADDFLLFDGGQPREISNFVLDSAPVNVLFMLDTSGSVKEELTQIRYSAIRFSQYFDRDDRMAVVAFSDEIEVLQPWTNNLGNLRKSLRRLKAGYRTALYDCVLKAARLLLSEVSGKRVMILLTDGLDNESLTSYEKVLNELTEMDVILYIVSRTRIVQDRVEGSDRVEFLDRVMKNVLGDDGSFVDAFFREKELSMNHLAEVNAGRVFYPEKLQALGPTYVQIAEELKTQYLLTFLAREHGADEFQSIRVECKRIDVEVFHRRLYKTR